MNPGIIVVPSAIFHFESTYSFLIANLSSSISSAQLLDPVTFGDVSLFELYLEVLFLALFGGFIKPSRYPTSSSNSSSETVGEDWMPGIPLTFFIWGSLTVFECLERLLERRSAAPFNSLTCCSDRSSGFSLFLLLLVVGDSLYLSEVYLEDYLLVTAGLKVSLSTLDFLSFLSFFSFLSFLSFLSFFTTFSSTLS
jgi:hypothetical protein